MTRAQYTSASKAAENPVPTSGDRAELAAYSVREALLDVVWSNVEIPRAMKGVVARGMATSSYSKKFDAERVLIGTDLRPQWPAPPTDGRRLAYEVLDQYGPSFEMNPEQDAEFLRMHTLRQYGHLVYSDDDMPKLAEMAKAEGATPETFGLLETIRIERRMGIALGRSFEWDNFYPSTEADKLPAVDRPLFHWLRDGWRYPEPHNPERETLLAEFYDRLIGAVDSREVADLAIEWRDKIFPAAFPQPPEQEPQHGEGDDQQENQTPSSSQQGKGNGKGKGTAGSAGSAGSGSPSKDPSDFEPQSGQDAEGSAENKEDTPPGDRKPGAGDESPKDGAEDPYGTHNERKEGESSLMNHINSGLKSNARMDEAAAKASSKGAEPSSGGKDGKEGKGAKGGKGAQGGTEEIKAPTHEEASSARGHGYSKSEGAPSKKDIDPSSWGVSPKNIELLEGSTDYFATHLFGRHGRHAIDKEQATKAKRILERMLTGQSRNVLSDSPSKRISMRHMARGEMKFNKREDFSRGSMNIDMVVDCSGSMSGTPIDSARSLILALSELTTKGLITGRIIFSSGEGWMACPLPMKEAKIELICAFSGSEGIQRALTDNVRKLRTSDAVFVYTDAEITDRAFDKSELKARKVEPMGLYVGSEKSEKGMRSYFDRYIIRENLEELCLGMVQRFISQRKLVLSTQAKKAKMR